MLTTSSFGEGFLSAYLPAMPYAELYCLFYAEKEKKKHKTITSQDYVSTINTSARKGNWDIILKAAGKFLKQSLILATEDNCSLIWSRSVGDGSVCRMQGRVGTGSCQGRMYSELKAGGLAPKHVSPWQGGDSKIWPLWQRDLRSKRPGWRGWNYHSCHTLGNPL